MKLKYDQLLSNFAFKCAVRQYSARFQALGQRHPAQACFIRCDADCVKWAHERRLEEGGEEAEEAGDEDSVSEAEASLSPLTRSAVISTYA